MTQQVQVDHETFRREQWEGLKNFRSKYDSEFQQSESILDQTQLINKKKEIDKLLLNAVRMSIMADEAGKVISYMEMMNFSQSLKLCQKLCEQLRATDTASKVAKYIQEREMKDIFQTTPQAATKPLYQAVQPT